MDNVVLIIGNGFDLELGLPTQYSDFVSFTHFINLMIHNRVNMAIELLCDLENTINSNLNKVTQKYLDIIFEGQKSTTITYLKTCGFSPSYDKYAKRAIKVFDKWKELLANNMWFDYFWKKNNLNGGWIDFEADIGEIIEYLDRSRYASNGKPDSLDTELSELARTKIYALVDQTLIVDPHVTYRTLKNKALEDLVRLTKALSFYMKDEIDKIELSLGNERDFLKYAIDETINATKTYVLDFNYTTTFERLIEAIYRKHVDADVCHIHGTVKKGENEGKIVLGIDEYLTNEQLQRNVDFTEFKKYYQRIDKETDSKYLYWLEELNNGGDTKIIIIGHSLGMTDGDVLRQFLNSRHVKVVDCYFYNQCARKQQISNLAGILGKDELIQRITGPQKCIRQILQQ